MIKLNKNLVVFISLVFSGFILYMPIFVNILPNPDAVWNSTVYKDSWRWETSLGRFGIKILQDLKGGGSASYCNWDMHITNMLHFA